MVENVVVGFEDAVRKPVVAHVWPDVLDRIQLGDFGGGGKSVMLPRTGSFSETCHCALSEKPNLIAGIAANNLRSRVSLERRGKVDDATATPTAPGRRRAKDEIAQMLAACRRMEVRGSQDEWWRPT